MLRRNLLGCLMVLPPRFWADSLQRSARCSARCPGPLEVEAAKVARNVHDFTDEKQAGDLTAFHRFGGEFIGVDSAASHFRLFIAFGACGDDGPGMRLLLKIGESCVRPGLRCVVLEPAVGEPGWQGLAEF